MTVNDIDVSKSLERAEALLKKAKGVSPELIAMMELLILIIRLLVGKLNTNSSNSSIPPSKNPLGAPKGKKKKKIKGAGKKKKPGAQTGHTGSNLEHSKSPDEVKVIEIDRRTIPQGKYTSAGFETRQVFDVKISTYITEYQAEILIDEDGNKFVADFPDGVSSYAQYGAGVKAQSVYMSIWQLVPLARVAEFFDSQLGFKVSKGSVANFNSNAFDLLEEFDRWVRAQLDKAELLHADETGANIGGKTHWLHSLSNDAVALFHIDEKRGREAMIRMGILEGYQGKVIHDHWKPYYSFEDITHCLCNAHHLRELKWSYEVDEKEWAGKMHDLLSEMNEAQHKNKGAIPVTLLKKYKSKYRRILAAGDKECPYAEKEPGIRGRPKQTKSRNLLDRLRDFEDDVLRFASDKTVPFTNNPAENDIRMTKVKLKISGCFRSVKGAQIFCRIRSFLLTCQKQGCNPFECLEDLFDGKLPKFMK